MTTLPWVVVVSFMFTGHQGVKVAVRLCNDLRCVMATERLAQQDPAATGVAVYQPGTYAPLPGSKLPVWPPLRNWQKL